MLVAVVAVVAVGAGPFARTAAPCADTRWPAVKAKAGILWVVPIAVALPGEPVSHVQPVVCGEIWDVNRNTTTT